MTQLQTAATINTEQVEAMRASDNRRIADELRRTARVTSLRKRQFNPYRKLSKQQIAMAADTFDAQSTSISARKARINVRLEPVRRLNQLTDEAYNLWRAMTVPYPEHGRRVIRVERVDELEAQVNRIKLEIQDAEAALDDCREEVLSDARERLGSLFNRFDYPDSFKGFWSVEVEYPNIEPDAKLCQLHPDIYEREVRRIQQRFDQCVERTEQELAKEFADMVGKLAERMEPKPDGKRKIFHKTTIENLTGFFDRFRQLNLGSNSQLDALVDQATEVVNGINPKELKTDDEAREQIRQAMAGVGAKLETLLVDAPNREITFDDDE